MSNMVVPFFTLDECKEIIKLTDRLQLIPRDSSTTSHLGVHSNISYNSYNIERDLNTQWIFDRITKFLKDKGNIEIVKDLDILHVHKYQEGDQFTKHRDMYYKNQILNVGVTLTDEYEGGDFILYEPKEFVPKKAGNIYSFKNTRLHEIRKVKKGIRWSMIGFVLTDHINLECKLL